jgi:hypothetical protein
MIRLLSVFFAGTLLGGAAVWLSLSEHAGLPEGSKSDAVALCSDRPRAEELAAVQAELAEWKRRASAALRDATPIPSAAEHSRPISAEATTTEPQQIPQSTDAVRWKVSAIEKFVPLTEDQRQRLKAKFEREAAASPEDRGDIESLEDILGQDNSRFYREQVKAAFKRVQDEELDREVVWLARQLSLSDAQEQAIHDLFERIEQRIEAEEAGQQQPGSPQERVQAMIRENKRRAELRSEELRALLSPEQYESYMKTQAESAAADVELFHG